MNQDIRTLLAIALSVAVFVVWSYVAPKRPVQEKAVSSEQFPPEAGQPMAEAVSGQKAGVIPPSPPLEKGGKRGFDPQANIPIQTTTIETDLYKVVLTNDGGIPTSWQIKKYRGDGEFVDLAADSEIGLLVASGFSIPPRPRYRLASASDSNVVYKWRSDKVELTKEYIFNLENCLVDVVLTAKNLTRAPIEGSVGLSIEAAPLEKKDRGLLGFLKGPANNKTPISYIDGKVSRERAFGSPLEKAGKLYWSGIEDRYFLSAIIPRSNAARTLIGATTSGGPMVDVSMQKGSLPAGSEKREQFSIYVGPKEMESLKVAQEVRLEEAIDYGWFWFIAIPLLKLMRFFYKFIPNYGIAIILLTVFVRLLMYPLTHHQMKSMKAMQALSPHMKELREKYKNDKERLNLEMMQLFRRHKVNPMAGCLPLVLQLPIYIALYRVLWNSIELYRAPFFWFYRDLSAPDPYYISPILLGFAMFWQQKMTPTAGTDPAQAKMMQFMPIMFTAFMLFLPAGLVIYILISTAMGLGQQWHAGRKK